jgi:hypothetical protein
MKPVDRLLEKLLKAAARTPRGLAESEPVGESASFALEAAVIAQLRSAAPEDEFARLVPLFRYAMVFGLVMMLLSGAWNYFESQGNSGATALASYAMTQMPP